MVCILLRAQAAWPSAGGLMPAARCAGCDRRHSRAAPEMRWLRYVRSDRPDAGPLPRSGGAFLSNAPARARNHILLIRDWQPVV